MNIDPKIIKMAKAACLPIYTRETVPQQRLRQERLNADIAPICGVTAGPLKNRKPGISGRLKIRQREGQRNAPAPLLYTPQGGEGGPPSVRARVEAAQKAERIRFQLTADPLWRSNVVGGGRYRTRMGKQFFSAARAVFPQMLMILAGETSESHEVVSLARVPLVNPTGFRF